MTPTKRQKIDPVVSEEDCQTFVNELEVLNKTENFSEVKSFIIFGNSLYHNDFQIKFAGYECIKMNRDYKMTANFLNEIYTKFLTELYGELEIIFEDVKLSETTPNKEIFYCLQAQVEYNILQKFCKSLDTPYDQSIFAK